MTVRIVTASTPQLLEDRVNVHLDDGWHLVGPVQAAVSADGGFAERLLVATLTKVSVPARVQGSGAGRDREHENDPLVGPDQAREDFWDTPQ